MDTNLWVLGGILFCTPSILFLLGYTLALRMRLYRLEEILATYQLNMDKRIESILAGYRIAQKLDSDQINVRLGGAEERVITRANKFMAGKEAVIDEKYKKMGDGIVQAERVAASVTVAVSDVLAELQRFLDAARKEQPHPVQEPVDFDKLRNYALDYPDEVTPLTTPNTLRQCCEGIKPGCHAWVDIGELCEELWDSHVEQPE
jgi:hypothetical protein